MDELQKLVSGLTQRAAAAIDITPEAPVEDETDDTPPPADDAPPH